MTDLAPIVALAMLQAGRSKQSMTRDDTIFSGESSIYLATLGIWTCHTYNNLPQMPQLPHDHVPHPTPPL